MNLRTKVRDNLGKLMVVSLFAIFCLGVHWQYFMRQQPTDSFRLLCVIVGVILFVLVYVEFFLAYIKEWPIHRLYLIAGLIIGFLFVFVIPPYATPDERTHTASCIHVSNVIMGYGEPDDGINNLYMRNTENEAQVTEYVKRAEYNAFLDNFSLSTSEYDRELTSISIPYPGPAILYIIPGIGITIGRLLHWGGSAVFVIATLFNVLFFVISTTVAIRIIPFGKEVMMTVALFPMVLQLTSSLSYDNAVLSGFFMVIAIGLKWSYAKNELITKKEIVTYLIYGAIVCLVKGGVYAMFLLLPIICNSTKSAIKRIWDKYKSWIIIGIVLFLLILGRNVIISAFKSIFTSASAELTQSSETANSLWNNNYITWAEDEGYTIQYFLHKPLSLVMIFLNTFISLMTYYTGGMIASPLGWLNIDVPWFYIMSYVVVLFIASIKQENSSVYISAKDRIWIIIFAIISIGLSLAAMLMYWTPITYGVIAGVQGRYFIPPMLMLVLYSRNDVIVSKKNMARGVLMAILILTMMSVYYIFNAAIS